MATSSFDKVFILDTQEAVESFERMFSTPNKSIKINRNLVSPERERESELKLRQMLSHENLPKSSEK